MKRNVISTIETKDPVPVSLNHQIVSTIETQDPFVIRGVGLWEIRPQDPDHLSVEVDQIDTES